MNWTVARNRPYRLSCGALLSCAVGVDLVAVLAGGGGSKEKASPYFFRAVASRGDIPTEAIFIEVALQILRPDAVEDSVQPLLGFFKPGRERAVDEPSVGKQCGNCAWRSDFMKLGVRTFPAQFFGAGDEVLLVDEPQLDRLRSADPVDGSPEQYNSFLSITLMRRREKEVAGLQPLDGRMNGAGQLGVCLGFRNRGTELPQKRPCRFVRHADGSGEPSRVYARFGGQQFHGCNPLVEGGTTSMHNSPGGYRRLMFTKTALVQRESPRGDDIILAVPAARAFEAFRPTFTEKIRNRLFNHLSPSRFP